MLLTVEVTAMRSLWTVPLTHVLLLLRRFILSLERRHGSRSDAISLADVAAKEMALGRFASASRLAEAAIAEDPSLEHAYVLFGLASSRQGDSAKARGIYNEAIRILPNSIGLLTALGDLDYKEGRYADAETAYRRVLNCNPPDASLAQIQTNLAIVLSEQGRLEEAADVLEDVRRGSYNALAPALALGHVYLSQKRYEEAVSLLREATKVHPASARAHYDLVYGLAGLQQWQDALVESRLAYELEPNNEAYGTLLQSLQEQTDHKGR